MDLAYYVGQNQGLIDDIKSRTPGQEDVDMYYGTLDYATARFNTILLKLSQDKLKEVEYQNDVEECFQAIQKFYKYVQHYRFWPRFTRPFLKIVLHGIGTRRIPKIKQLLTKVNN